MRKLLIGTALIAALSAAPAIASGAETLRVGDRVGALKGEHSDYLSKPVTIALAFTVLAATIWVWNEDREDDDSPASI